jgi:(R,R)-butanediol dehydrogenase/meso-butanediol dehydrogenase/diacetyl reductase
MGVPTACGRCRPCRAGHWHRCEGFFELIAGATHGAYAPRIAVAASALIPVLDALSDEEAAQVEPATVALHAVRRRPPRLGDVVLVLGAGPIGLCVLQHARLAGAWRVVVAEPREHRRALATELGADVVLPPGDELHEELDRLTGALGADVVYECAGSRSSMSLAIDVARPGGTVMMVAVAPESISVSPGTWLSKELTLDSSLAHHHHEFEITMRLVADGRVRLAPLHARTIGLAGIPDALGDLADGGDDAKILVDPRIGASS